jgi:hypothetical protein
LDKAKPFLPLAATGVQEFVVTLLAKGDPARANELRRQCGTFAQAIGVASGGASPDAAARFASSLMGQAPGGTAAPIVVEPAPSEVALPRPKVVREVLGQLEDVEAEAFEELLDGLPPEQFEAVGRELAGLGGVAQRVEWVRTALRAVVESLKEAQAAEASAQAGASAAGEVPSVGGLADMVPPELAPILAQLSQEEIQVGIQMLATLDRATIEKLTARLISLTPEKALATIRIAIAESMRRAPSVAQRAVASALDAEVAQATGGAL